MVADSAHRPAEKDMRQSLPESTPVLIVGGGPVGALTALLLAKLNLSSVVIEQFPSRQGHPKAHATGPRTIEILRQGGVDTVRLRKAGLSSEDGHLVRFVESIMGTEFTTIEYERQDEGAAEFTPERMFNIAQPLLEEHILETALATGKVKLIRMIQWLSCKEETDGTITSTVKDRHTEEELTINSKYLVGCDGSRSAVRAFLEIPWEPVEGTSGNTPGYYASAHVQMDLTHVRRAALWKVFDRERAGGFICYDPKDNWAYITHYNPEKIHTDDLNEEWFRTSINKAIGQETDFKIRSISKWVNIPCIARTYRSDKIKGAFLAGDASHAFPPTGGLGVNTGLPDAHNLAWKIYAVEQGWANADFLDTVTTDRRPIAEANSQQSHFNDLRFRVLAKTVWEFDPKATAAELVQNPEFRKKLQEALEYNAQHYDSLNLQIGLVYGRRPTRPCNVYVKEVLPGGRLPHTWLEKDGQPLTPLDTVSLSSFALFTSEGFTEDSKIEIDGVPVTVVQRNRDYQDPTGEWVKLMGLDGAQAAVLVRPDQHIVGTVNDLEGAEKLLKQYLGKS